MQNTHIVRIVTPVNSTQRAPQQGQKGMKMKNYDLIDLANPETYANDPVLNQFVRRHIAMREFKNLGVSIGDAKKQLLAGQHPETVARYVSVEAANKSAKNKLQSESTEIAASIVPPPGYSLAIQSAEIVISGKFDQALHEKIKRASGEWDGHTGTNRKVWLIPIEEAASLKRALKNFEKMLDGRVDPDQEARARQKDRADQIEAEYRAHREAQKIAAAAKKNAQRYKVVAGTVQVGQTYCGSQITGLGKTWEEVIPDHDCSVYGLAPGLDYEDRRITFQYAYAD